MDAKITKAFRFGINNGRDGIKRFFPGDIANGKAAEFAIEYGYGEKVTKKVVEESTVGMTKGSAPSAKAKPAAKNKSKKAPDNK